MKDISRHEARRQLSVAGLETRAGNVSAGKYKELNQAYQKSYPGAPQHASKCSPSNPCQENSVDLEQVGQETDWWCGPAVAYMVIDQLSSDGTIDGSDSSSGDDLSQSALADDEYTDSESGGTYRVDMRKALNKWTGEKFYHVMNNPTTKDFRAALLENIDRGQSFAVAALEPAGGPHYNGHPTSMTVDHWVAAKGYSDRGLTAEFADPSTTIWSSASPTFSYNTKEFVQNFVQPEKAIVW